MNPSKLTSSAHQLPVSFPPTASEVLAPLSNALSRLEVMLETQCSVFEPSIATCARYVVCNQGKRLRPALTIYAANAHRGCEVGIAEEAVLKACSIVELIHIATLVHDDIMDGAKLRRNRLTAGAKWGQEISVLLGDSLFSHALVLAASYSTSFVCRRVAEATRLVCSGEILQTQRRFDLKLHEADYLKMVELKTGALFAVACELGAHVAGASPTRVKTYYEFGRLLGIAYQIYDDCLDIVGKETETGKSLGTDLQKGKITLPIILLLQKAQESETHLISSILLNGHTPSHGMLLDFIRRYGTLEQSIQQARSILHRAVTELKDLPPSEGRNALEKLAVYLDGEIQRLRT